jgi:valyl-tRNA synthetase
LVAATRWPQPPAIESPSGVDELQALIIWVRRFRAEHELSPKTPIDLLVDDPAGIAQPWWREQVASMANVVAAYEGPPPQVAGHTRFTSDSLQAFVPLAGLVDVAAERPRLEKAIAETEQLLARSRGKLENPNFAERAPAEVVAGERRKVEEFTAKLEKLRVQLQELG